MREKDRETERKKERKKDRKKERKSDTERRRQIGREGGTDKKTVQIEGRGEKRRLPYPPNASVITPGCASVVTPGYARVVAPGYASVVALGMPQSLPLGMHESSPVSVADCSLVSLNEDLFPGQRCDRLHILHRLVEELRGHRHKTREVLHRATASAMSLVCLLWLSQDRTGQDRPDTCPEIP